MEMGVGVGVGGELELGEEQVGMMGLSEAASTSQVGVCRCSWGPSVYI